LHAQVENLLHNHWLAPNHVFEHLPVEQFHGDEMAPIGFIDPVNRADVRMVQR